MRVGLLFGSFNPVHHGHLMLASHLAQNGNFDQVWLVLSPQNPFKLDNGLAPESDRLHMLELAVEGDPRLLACDVELSLSRPSYTIHTLKHLAKTNPNDLYTVIIGSDNLARFGEWKAATEILETYQVLVYPRPDHPIDLELMTHPHMTIVENVPQILISSTYLRNQIANGNNVRYLIPESVRSYIEDSDLYSKNKS